MYRFLWVLVAGLLACLVEAPPPLAAASGTKTFVYIHDDASPDNRVFGFQFNSNGTLTPLDGSPFSTGDDTTGCGGLCQTAAFSSNRNLLFVGGATGITAFRVDASGGLSRVEGSPFGGELTLGVASVQRGSRSFVYGSEVTNNRLVGFEVQADDTLAPLRGSPFPTDGEPAGLSAANDLLFTGLLAPLEVDGKIAAFKVRSDGVLVQAPGSPFDIRAVKFINVQVEAAGKFVYVNDATNGNLFAFKVNPHNAALTPVAGSPFADVLFDSESLAVSKKPILVSLESDDVGVQAFRRNKSGSLTALGGVQDSGLAHQHGVGAFDPTGRFLVLVDDENDEVRSFSVNQNTGVITPVDTESADLDSQAANGVVFAQPRRLR